MNSTRVAAAIIMSIVYGYDIAPKNDYFVSLSEAATEKLSDGVFLGAMAVNTLPFLKYLPAWLPGTGFLVYARETRELTTQMQEVPLEYVKKGMVCSFFIPLIYAPAKGPHGLCFRQRELRRHL